MRGTGQGRGVHQHDEAHADAREIHLPERGDGRGDVAPEDIDGDLVAKADAHFRRFLGGKAELRRAVIVFAPPHACRERGARGQRIRVAHGAVALDHPMAGGHFLRGAAVDAGDEAAQHRRVIDAAHLRVGGEAVQKPRHLVLLQIDEEEGGRALGKIARDGTAQVAVDLPDGGQHRQAEAEREHHRPGRAARPADHA